jgi:site-specific recombinase XerD
MKLLEQLLVVGRRRRLAPNTLDAYSSWVRQFLTFCRAPDRTWRHPAQLATADVEAFLNDLVTRRRQPAASQNQPPPPPA